VIKKMNDPSDFRARTANIAAKFLEKLRTESSDDDLPQARN
jgi:hypothetical protein